MIGDITNYFQENMQEYSHYLWQHLSLSMMALVIALGIALPLGYLGFRLSWFRSLSTTLIQGLRVIPSLGILFIFIPFLGVGRLPAIIALVILGMPPILLNTIVGFSDVSKELIEVGQAMGMTRLQLFKQVEFSLALPHLLNGIKLALIEIIASATLATYIGAGGLGTLIFTGLGLYRIDLLLIGGISVAGLSLVTMLLFDWIIERLASNDK